MSEVQEDSANPHVPSDKSRKRTSTRRRQDLCPFLSSSQFNIRNNVPVREPKYFGIRSSEKSCDSPSQKELQRTDLIPSRCGADYESSTSGSSYSSNTNVDSPPEKRYYGHVSQSSRNHQSTRKSSSSTKSSTFLPEEESELSKALRLSYDFPSIDDLLKFCFGKKFPININLSGKRKTNEPCLYTAEKWDTLYQLREFQALKDKLNTVKNKLDYFDLNDWHKHTRATNPADLVMRRLRSEMKVEFLTQAWCKFYELIDEFNLIPKDARHSQMLYSVHLCEAPGAFVASLNHYLKLNHPRMKWYWMANSLNPYYEGNTPSQMINDDRFMLQTIGKWDFGPDMTGDICHPQYPNYLRSKCGGQLAHLVTADGSIDCQNTPEEQESSVSWLHFKETLTALRVLRRGGHFVIKMFTFFECDTICLLYLLSRVFESINVTKPVTSKEGNSEVYVVCTEFRGDDVASIYLEELLEIDENRHKKFAMFSYSQVSRIFMRKLLECAKIFANNQILIINRNIRLFPDRHNEGLRRHFVFVQEKLWQKFVETYRVKPIPLSENIVSLPTRQYEIRKHINVMEKRDYKRGSHLDNLIRKGLAKNDVFYKISTEMAEFERQTTIKNARMPNVNISPKYFQVVLGRPIKTVLSSQFCHGTFIRMRNEVMDKVTAPSYNIFSLIDLRRKFDFPKCKMCDFRKTFAFYACNDSTYSEAQLEAFGMIFDQIFDMKDGEDLIFIGFPLLTQFNVNVLCFLKQIFREIEIKDENIIYLSDISRFRLEKWSENLDSILRNYTRKNAVLSFLPLDCVTGANNSLYSWFVDANNARVCKEIRVLIDFNPSTSCGR